MSKFIFAVFLFGVSLTSHAMENRVIIIRQQNADNPHHRTATRYILMKDQGLTCETDAVPKHRIKVKGFRLNDPMGAKGVSSKGCKDTVQWGNRKICYERNVNPKLDEVFRQCANF